MDKSQRLQISRNTINRNSSIIKLWHADVSMTAIGAMFNISRQRVSQIIHAHSKHCQNCYHFQISCACRERNDMVTTGNCPDWYPQEGV